MSAPSSPSTLDFQVLFEAGSAACLVLTPRFDIIATSNAYLRAVRMRREQLVGRNLFEVFWSEPSEREAAPVAVQLRASLERVLRTREPDAMDVQPYGIPRAEAEGGGVEPRYWSPSNTPILDAAGQLLYVVHQVEDVTRFTRRQPPADPPPAAEPPRRLGRLLLVDDDADMRGYVHRVLAQEFEVEDVEDGQAALESALARPPDLVLTDVMMPRLDGVGLLRALRGASPTQHLPILLLSARAGEQSMLEALDAGADDYLVKPFSAQELLARVRSNLELVRMRREVTRERAHRENLAEAIQARDDFLSVASHELRTPLATFQLHLDIAERGLRESAQHQAVERLVRARRFVRRLASLVDLMLDVSQITSGQLSLARTPVDLAELLGETLPLAEEEARRAGTEFSVRMEGPARGDFDAPRLSQVFHHLMSNALKFGAGRTVEVRLRGGDGQARLDFVDHGLGIRPEDKARIFERFERAVSARNYGGLGLGLWVAREVVEAHAGRIEVSDTPGGGTTFHIILPLAPAPSAER